MKLRGPTVRANSAGRAVVGLHETTSPSLANFIAQHESTRTATRVLLFPVVYAVVFPRTAILLTSLSLALLVVWRRSRIPKPSRRRRRAYTRNGVEVARLRTSRREDAANPRTSAPLRG